MYLAKDFINFAERDTGSFVRRDFKREAPENEAGTKQVKVRPVISTLFAFRVSNRTSTLLY